MFQIIILFSLLVSSNLDAFFEVKESTKQKIVWFASALMIACAASNFNQQCKRAAPCKTEEEQKAVCDFIKSIEDDKNQLNKNYFSCSKWAYENFLSTFPLKEYPRVMGANVSTLNHQRTNFINTAHKLSKTIKKDAIDYLLSERFNTTISWVPEVREEHIQRINKDSFMPFDEIVGFLSDFRKTTNDSATRNENTAHIEKYRLFKINVFSERMQKIVAKKDSMLKLCCDAEEKSTIAEKIDIITAISQPKQGEISIDLRKLKYRQLKNVIIQLEKIQLRESCIYCNEWCVMQLISRASEGQSRKTENTLCKNCKNFTDTVTNVTKKWSNFHFEIDLNNTFDNEHKRFKSAYRELITQKCAQCEIEFQEKITLLFSDGKQLIQNIVNSFIDSKKTIINWLEIYEFKDSLYKTFSFYVDYCCVKGIEEDKQRFNILLKNVKRFLKNVELSEKERQTLNNLTTVFDSPCTYEIFISTVNNATSIIYGECFTCCENNGLRIHCNGKNSKEFLCQTCFEKLKKDFDANAKCPFCRGGLVFDEESQQFISGENIFFEEKSYRDNRAAQEQIRDAGIDLNNQHHHNGHHYFLIYGHPHAVLYQYDPVARSYIMTNTSFIFR